MSDHVKAIKDADFENLVLKSTLPVLVDFWAPWCGPCKSIAPILDKIAEKFEGKITIVKINVDENQGTPSTYGVRGIPNLILFKDGQQVEQKVGALPEKELNQWISSHISETIEVK